jgi:hypothetical protein
MADDGAVRHAVSMYPCRLRRIQQLLSLAPIASDPLWDDGTAAQGKGGEELRGLLNESSVMCRSIAH